MHAAIHVFIVLLVLYVAGRIMYQGRGRRHRLRMLHVVLNFVLVMVANAIIMLTIMGLSVALELLAGIYAPDLAVDFFSPSGKLAGETLLLYLFVVIFLTAFVHYGLRSILRKLFHVFELEDDEISIFEYFVQWMTIYFVVYQCIFEGLGSLFAWAGGSGEGISEIFEIFLKPENLNLVIQPLLISSWILVVLERFARQSRGVRGKDLNEGGGDLTSTRSSQYRC